jgi:hypothetical protein
VIHAIREPACAFEVARFRDKIDASIQKDRHLKPEFLAKLPALLRTIFQTVMNWWDDLLMQAVMSLIWSVSWFTVVLGPPVTFGIYYVQSQYIEGENLGLRGMVDGARRYFFTSWKWMLTNLLVFLLFFASTDAYQRIEGPWASAARDITILFAAGWAISQFYTIPFVMRQGENTSLWQAWRSSLLLCLASPFYLAGLLLFLAVFGVFSMLLIFPVILGFVPMLSMLSTQALQDRLETFREMAEKEEG